MRARWTELRAPILTGLLVAMVGIAVVSPARPHSFFRWMSEGPRDEHDIIARNLIEHGRFSMQISDWKAPTVARGPLYPLYLAAVYKASGLMNRRAVRTTDQVIHALSAALIVGALQSFVPAGAAIAGGLLYAFWPTTYYYVAKGGSETVQILALVVSLFCLVSLRKRPALSWAIALGIGIAAACLGRGNAVVMLVIVGVWAAAAVARRTLAPRFAVAIALAWALTMSPWWIRNARVTGEFVPFHTLLWYNAYHDDIMDWAKRSQAARGEVNLDVHVEYPRLPASLRHPGDSAATWVLGARDDVARERRYREIMLRRYREPGYLAGKMARNAVDFWSAGGTIANDRKLLATSLVWLALFATGLALALRDPALRWCALVCSGFVALTWLLYLPVVALFRYSLPTTPFVAATIALGLGAVLRARGGGGAARVARPGPGAE